MALGYPRTPHQARLALSEQRQGPLRVQVLASARGAAAIGPTTGAAALDEGSGQHVAQGEQSAHQPTAQFEFRVLGHALG